MTNSAIHPFQRSPARGHNRAGFPSRALNTSTYNMTAHVAGPKAVDSPAPKYLDRILIRKARRMLLVRTEDIHLIEAAGNYVRINTADAQHLLRSPLTELAEALDPQKFLRIHRSAIVNTEYLESVETNPAGDYFARLPGGRRLKCSRSYRGDLRLFLAGFGA